MNGRAFVLIFFFWAVLTVVTPTLIILSASAKSNFNSNGEKSSGLKARRMMGSLEGERIRRALAAPAPAQAPAPAPSPRHRIIVLTKFWHGKET
uniref:Uncharacterized protein n=1 Tax=Nelumbo nucifera TaxID=4432 RepID=A0A822ZGI6_NELNU|nr:TPA_asm: hypothetical protein HUJ06_015081 [Nelumbo nucifera]